MGKSCFRTKYSSDKVKCLDLLCVHIDVIKNQQRYKHACVCALQFGFSNLHFAKCTSTPRYYCYIWRACFQNLLHPPPTCYSFALLTSLGCNHEPISVNPVPCTNCNQWTFSVFPAISGVTIPLFQEGQSVRIFPNFAFSARFSLFPDFFPFFPNFPLVGNVLAVGGEGGTLSPCSPGYAAACNALEAAPLRICHKMRWKNSFKSGKKEVTVLVTETFPKLHQVLSKMVNHFLSKSSKFCIVWTRTILFIFLQHVVNII